MRIGGTSAERATTALPTWVELFLDVPLFHHQSQRAALVSLSPASTFLVIVYLITLILPEANCTYTTNDIGECGGCNQQFFINEDCDQAFYCSTSAMAEGEEGCSKQCSEGEVRNLTKYINAYTIHEIAYALIVVGASLQTLISHSLYTGRINGPVQPCMGVHRAGLRLCMPRAVKHFLPRG